jgi:hypothetical protein
MQGKAVQGIYRDWEMFRHFAAFGIVLSNTLLGVRMREYCKMPVEKKQVYCGNIEIITITEIYNVFVSIYFASGGQINQILCSS